ncbi:MAG TPA: ABC transporter permease [Candidatus Acidoferrum sp.]|nr:ABC transporter permease [Candidatus Acidoferrum sp.]
MSIEWFVAHRYLRSPNRPAVLRLVTVFSVLGVAAGVCTLVISLAMNTGFRETLQDHLLSVTSHVSLTRPGSSGIHDYDALAKKLATVHGVRSATPAVYQTVLLSFGGQARGIVAKGIDAGREAANDAALARLSAGKLDFSEDADGAEGIVVGKQLADEWKISPGDFVTMTSPQGRLTPFGLLPRTKRFRIAGIFDSGFYDYDANWCFMDIKSAQALAGASDVVNVIEFRLNDPEQAEQIAATIKSQAGPGFSTATWMEENRPLFRALRLEKLVTAIFIGLITFVAGLNILAVLSMTVTDKAKDVAILLSMGARREQIRNIFLWQGIAIGACGTLAGLLLGYTFALTAGTWHWIPLDPQVYAVSYVPFHANLLDGLWISVIAMLISVAATLVPARAAARLLPVEILRFE